jgi:chemotaxis protein CheC
VSLLPLCEEEGRGRVIAIAMPGFTLTALQLSALNEIANIGAGQASTALAALTGELLDLSVPETDLLPVAELTRLARGALEEPVAAAYLPFAGDADGCMLLLFSQLQALSLFELLGLHAPATLLALDDLHKSALAEAGNIVAATYLNALAEFSGLRLHPSPPGVAVGMMGAILGSIAGLLGQNADQGLVVHLHIVSIYRDLGLRLIMVPQLAGLSPLLAALGLPVETR